MPERTFFRNHEQAQNTAREQLKIICANLSKLTGKTGAKMKEAARSFRSMVERNEKFTPNQLSYIDGIYEKVMAGAGFDAVSVHVDKKKKGLRFG